MGKISVGSRGRKADASRTLGCFLDRTPVCLAEKNRVVQVKYTNPVQLPHGC